MKKVAIGFLICLWLSCAGAFAQQQKANAVAPVAKESAALDAERSGEDVDRNKPRVAAENNALKAEVIALKEQNKIIKEYQDDLLATVYWSLAALLTFAVLLAGFSSFSNFKMYEADQAKLKKDLDAKTKDLEQRIDVQISAGMERIVAEGVRDTTARIDAAIQPLIAEDARIREVTDDLQKIAKSLVEACESNTRGLSGAEADLRLVEEIVWDIRGLPDNVLVTQGQGLEAAHKAGQKYAIGIILPRMKRTAMGMVEKRTPMKKSVKELVLGRLQTIESDYPIEVAELRDLLSQIPEE